MDQIKLLDLAKEITHSDAETARRIGVKQQRLDHVRSGHSKMSPWMAGKIGELLGKDPMAHAIEMHAANAKTEKEKNDWKRWAGVAAIFLAVFFLGEKPAFSATYADNAPRTVYTLCALILMIWRVRSNQRQQESWGCNALLGGVA